MAPEALYVGIDVAKAQLDVAVHPTDDRWVLPYTEAGRPPVRPLRSKRTVWGGRARMRATVRPVPAGRQSFRLTFKTVAPSREGAGGRSKPLVHPQSSNLAGSVCICRRRRAWVTPFADRAVPLGLFDRIDSGGGNDGQYLSSLQRQLP